LRRSWWLIVVLALAGGGAGFGYSKRQTPVYAGHVTFYVSSPSLNSADANQTNQFAQDRATSYAALLSSDALARSILAADPRIRLNERTLAHEISGTAQLNTILVDATIQDTSPKRALAIARGVGEQLPALVSRLDNKGANGTAATVSLTVVSGPRVGSAPILPRTKLNTLIGFVLGLLLGLGLAMLRELLDVSIRTADGLAEFSGVPVLGTIPIDPLIRSRRLVIGAASHSARAEAMRQLRTNLQFADAAAPVRTLVITSSAEGEGKSTTAVNLALVVAETGRRVLLVEADLRKPGVSDQLGLDRSLGLSSVLSGRYGFQEVLQPWGDSDLTVLPAGASPPNPSELLGGPRMAELMQEWATSYDLVIIDTPPLGPVTDAAVVAAEADGALVIFWTGRTKRTTLRAALNALDAVNARTLGCVLNMKPLTRADRRGYLAYAADADGSARRRMARLAHPFADEPHDQDAPASDDDAAAGDPAREEPAREDSAPAASAREAPAREAPAPPARAPEVPASDDSAPDAPALDAATSDAAADAAASDATVDGADDSGDSSGGPATFGPAGRTRGRRSPGEGPKSRTTAPRRIR